MQLKNIARNEPATNGSAFCQTRGCEAARAEGQGFASENAAFGAIHVQSGSDLVGADWERRLAARRFSTSGEGDDNKTKYRQIPFFPLREPAAPGGKKGLTRLGGQGMLRRP